MVLGIFSYAQNPVVFKVVSSTDNAGVSASEVAIYQQGESATPIIGGVADDNGKLGLSLPNGNYTAEIRAVGFEPFRKDFSVPQQSNQKIILIPSEEWLGQAVVTIQSRPQASTKTVERVLVITAEDLENRSVFNLRDALNQQMNIQISNDQSTGSSVSMMGVSGQNVKILIDGVPVIGRLDGNIDLSQINLNDIERIEVIEGPVSTAYGSNALAGVINIITKKKTKKKSELTVDAYHETNGQDNISFTSAKRIKDKYDVRFGGSRNFFAGWNPTDEGRFDQWKPKEQYNGRFQVARQGEKTRVVLKSEVFRELLVNKGRPLPSYYETAFDEEFRTWRIDQKVQFDRDIDSNKRFTGFLAYNRYSRLRNKFFRDLTTLSKEQVLTDGGEDTTGFNAFMSRGVYACTPKGKKIQYELGYDFIHQTGIGGRIADGQQDIGDYAVFATLNYDWLGLVNIKPGVRVAYNTAYRAPIAPTLSLRHKRKDYVYRLSYGRGFRAPDIKELYLYFVDVNHNVIGNPDLTAEKSHNFQASASGVHRIKNVLVRPSLTGFFNNIDDKITLANVDGLEYTYVNLDQFNSLGGNFMVSAASYKTKVSMGVSATHVESRTNGDLRNTSEFTYAEVNGSFSQRFGKFQFNVFGKFYGPRTVFRASLEDGEVTESRVDSYSLVDLQLSRPFWKKRLMFNIGCKNAFNVTNVNNELRAGGVHTSAPANIAIGTGRSYFIKTVINLSK